MKMISRIALAAVLLAPLSLRADDVTDAIDEGMSAYKAGNFADAATSLDYAAQLIRQKRSGDFAKALPAAPKGWKAEEGEGTAAMGMLGGAVTANREYNRENEEVSGHVTINIVADSPMMQGFLMMVSNPMIAASSPVASSRPSTARRSW
jgi:hypothetical protein